MKRQRCELLGSGLIDLCICIGWIASNYLQSHVSEMPVDAVHS